MSMPLPSGRLELSPLSHMSSSRSGASTARSALVTFRRAQLIPDAWLDASPDAVGLPVGALSDDLDTAVSPGRRSSATSYTARRPHSHGQASSTASNLDAVAGAASRLPAALLPAASAPRLSGVLPSRKGSDAGSATAVRGATGLRLGAHTARTEARSPVLQPRPRRDVGGGAAARFA